MYFSYTNTQNYELNYYIFTIRKPHCYVCWVFVFLYLCYHLCFMFWWHSVFVWLLLVLEQLSTSTALPRQLMGAAKGASLCLTYNFNPLFRVGYRVDAMQFNTSLKIQFTIKASIVYALIISFSRIYNHHKYNFLGEKSKSGICFNTRIF